MSTNARPLDFKSRVFIAVLGIFAGLYFTGGTNWLVDTMYFPWVHAEPPLLRSWVGQLTAGNGVPLMVAMDLERDLTTRGTVCVRCGQIKGAAATCDARGTLRRYRISGSPADREGRQILLGAVPDADPPPDGLELEVMRGTWNRGTRLELAADFHWRKGISAISATDDPATQPVPLAMDAVDESAIATLCTLAANRLRR